MREGSGGRLALAGLYFLAAALVGQVVWSTLFALHSRKGADFLVVHEAARQLLAGDRFYEVQRIARDLFGPNFHLPPFAALIATGFALLDKDSALSVWRGLSIAAHFGALALLLRTLGASSRGLLAPSLLALWALSWPARGTFINGQWDSFFLLALTLTWWAERGGRRVLGGLVLGLAGSVKPYPLLALGAFTGRRQLRFWLACAVAVLAATLAGYLAAPRETVTFFERVAPQLGATTALTENQSLAGFVARLIEPDMRPIATEQPAVGLVGRLLGLGALLPLALLALRRPDGLAGSDLRYAAWVALIPIVIPVAWMHYQQLLLLPLSLLITHWLAASERPGGLSWALCGLAALLINVGDHYTVLGPLAGELFKPEQTRVEAANAELLAQFQGLPMLLLSYKLYGALLLWILCLRAAWRRSVGYQHRREPAKSVHQGGEQLEIAQEGVER